MKRFEFVLRLTLAEPPRRIFPAGFQRSVFKPGKHGWQAAHARIES
jgi:hypothetical protein